MIAGRNISANAGRAPRVFLSYARSDGEPFATKLRQRLEAEHIPLWQDRVGMEGGHDWWQQITGALDKVEFMVLLLTHKSVRCSLLRQVRRTVFLPKTWHAIISKQEVVGMQLQEIEHYLAELGAALQSQASKSPFACS